LYKSNIFKGNNVLVLAAGLGIDDWAFSFSFDHVLSIDSDIELNEVSRYNFNALGRKNIKRIDGNVEEYLEEIKVKFDLIYIDPDRRNEKGRQILLSEHQPNVVELLPILFNLSPRILIKCSPLYDFEMAISEIPSTSEVYSVSKYGEMKELLILAERENKNENISIICSDILKENTINSYRTENKKAYNLKIADGLGSYLYEAGSCLVKMRKNHEYAMGLNLLALDNSIAFYTSNNLNNQFIGRYFKIIKSINYNVKGCLKYLNDNHISKANIKARGLKFNTEELKKKLKLKDGGEDYIFVIPFKNQTIMIHCTY
jgi:16S rRNA G966 N2-methylase RsmD